MIYDKMVSGTTTGVATRGPESAEGPAGEVTSRPPSQIRGNRMTKPVYPVHSYPWYIHDWRQSRTRLRLSPMGRYIYRELLDETYLDGSIPDDPALLAKICGVTEKEFLKHWPDVSRSFTLRDGAWHQDKVDEVLENLERWKDQRANAGRKSGASRRTKSQREANENERSFNGRSTVVEASSSSSTPTTTSTGWVDSESETETRYIEFRDAYPIDRRRDSALARQYYCQATGGTVEKHQRLMAALRSYVSRTEARYVQNMERWLESPPWHMADQAPEGEVRVVARDLEHWRQLKAEGKVSA